MKFLESIHFHLKVFYIFGQSPRLIKSKRHSFHDRMFIYIHAIIGLGLVISCFILLRMRKFRQYWFGVEFVILNCILVCDLLRIIAIIVQSIKYRKNLYSAIYTFQWIERYYAVYFRHIILYEKFVKQYKVKVLLIWCVYILYVAAFVWYASYYLHPVAVQIKILQALRWITVLQTIFYIDCLRFHLAELNAVIERDLCESSGKKSVFFIPKYHTNVNNTIAKFQRYKIVYLNLWETAQNINNYFGWSSMTLMTHIFVEVVYSTFWIYKTYHHHWPFLRIVRKSLGFFYLEQLCKLPPFHIFQNSEYISFLFPFDVLSN